MRSASTSSAAPRRGCSRSTAHRTRFRDGPRFTDSTEPKKRGPSLFLVLLPFALEVALLELALLLAALAAGRHVGDGIRRMFVRGLEVLPGLNAALLEIAHEIPQRGPDHVVREARIPGDVDAEREMLLEGEITRQLAAHEGERSLDRGARAADLVLAV